MENLKLPHLLGYRRQIVKQNKIRAMKKLFILLSTCLFSTGILSAQEGKTVSSKLTEATVYFNGAELIHTASSSLARGENSLTIEGLSPAIDMNSLKIRTTNHVIVSSYEFSIDYLSTTKASQPAIQKLQDSIKYYQLELEKIQISYSINQNMIAYLKSGIEKNVSGSEQGLGIDDLVKTMEYYRTKALELETEQTRLQRQQTDHNLSVARLQAQLSQESAKNSKTSGVLRLTLSAPAAGNTNFTVSYFTSAAAWSPYYDITISSTDKPIVFALKSKVRQTTGLDWERVKLTLSTATPSNGKVAPLFNAWFLHQVYPMAALQGRVNGVALQNSYAYADESLDEVVVVGYGRERKSTVTGAVSGGGVVTMPLYFVNGQEVSADYVGSLDPNMIADMKVLKDVAATNTYGSRAAAGAIVVTLKSSMDDFVTATENELNMVYNIDLPYSIPGNGKVQSIDLQTRETNGTYKYYCAPKLDTETYLLAEIANWQGLGLLSAPANITYDGTYIGETQINAASTEAKLSLTLGSDRRVAVKREKMQDFSSTRTLGSNTEQTFTYQITVKNNQNRAVLMVTKDQYPITTDRNITVTLNKDNTTPWTANVEELGVITWEEELAPGETKTYRISYTVKYPKEMTLNL